MAFAGFNGQQIFFEETGGDGPPVVLAHGFLMDHEMFAPQVDVLRGQYRVITWDERGFGQTEYDGKPFTSWDSASDCLGLLDHLGIDMASAQTLAAGLPGSDGVVQVPGAHAANLTHPEPVNAAIVQFLAALPA